MTDTNPEMLKAQIRHAEEMIALLQSGGARRDDAALDGQPAPLSADLLDEYRRVIVTCRLMLDRTGGKEGDRSP